MSRRERELLQELIKEAIKVTITKVENGKEETNFVDEIFDESSVDMEELSWFINKYRHKPLSWKKGKKKGLSDESQRDLDSVVELLLNDDAQQARLKEVIAPWGQVGFDALRRIYIATQRKGDQPMAPFPFFAAESQVETGSTIKIPKSPTPATVDFLMNTTARIGRNDTGKGELLLALMTGGIAGGPVGDLKIAGQNWELKDTRGSSIRLGGVTSKEFVMQLESNLQDFVSALAAPASSTLNLTAVLSLLSDKKSVDSLPAAAKDIINDCLANAVNKPEGSESLAGFVLVVKNGFMFVSTDKMKFDTYSSSGRVQVKFPTSAETSSPEKAVAKPADDVEVPKKVKRSSPAR